MTERRDGTPRPRRRPSTRVATIKVTAASLSAAAALTGGLAVQMASGHDPALGSPSTANARPKATVKKPDNSQKAVDTAPAPATVVTRSS